MDKVIDSFHGMVRFKGLRGQKKVSIVIINVVTVFYINIQYVHMYVHNKCIISNNLNGSS